MTTCSVCCEKTNKTINANIICKTCDYNACKKCIRTYLISITNQPHCMNCKVMWNTKFLVDNLNRSFVNTDLKKTKTQLLLDEHKSKISEYMYLVEYKVEKEKKRKRNK